MSDAVKITKVGRTVTGVMEPMMDGSFRETSYEGNLWRCEECGLVWDKKWYAETCAQREHATSFQQGPYG